MQEEFKYIRQLKYNKQAETKSPNTKRSTTRKTFDKEKRMEKKYIPALCQ